MRVTLAAIGAATLLLMTQAAGAAPQKYTWDGLGNGQGNCGIYRMHIEVTVDNGRAIGTFQQKGRPLQGGLFHFSEALADQAALQAVSSSADRVVPL